MGHTTFCDGCGKEVSRIDGYHTGPYPHVFNLSERYDDFDGPFSCKMHLKEADGNTMLYSFCNIDCLISSINKFKV